MGADETAQLLVPAAVRNKALDDMRRIAADKVLARDYMLKSSMIASMRRAADIA